MRPTISSIILGQQNHNKLQQAKMLVVGVGGTGCELLKSLSKMHVAHITLIDFDSVQQTNLNRQFYFRKEHIGLSKAHVVSQAISQLNPRIIIQALNIRMEDPVCNSMFFAQFDAIFSCLDSIKARQYLSQQATKANVPLIDTGTMGYNGQTYASVRFKTSCHNCSPSKTQAEPAVCTIRSRPERPIHCATFARNFFQSFFGSGQTLSDSYKFQKHFEAHQEYSLQQIKTVSILIFEELFNKGVSKVDLEGRQIDHVKKLYYFQTKEMTENLVNPLISTYSKSQHQKQQFSPYKQEKIFSIAQYSQIFIDNMMLLITHRLVNDIPIAFQKDDEEVMWLIVSITNLRTYCYMNEQLLDNKHKYLTYYQIKDLIGKVMPAIASTNAIGAALQTRQFTYLLTDRPQKLRYVSFGNFGDQKLSAAYQSGPNVHCNYCSPKVIYACLQLDMSVITLGEFQKYAADNLFSMNRDVLCGPYTISNNSKNKKKGTNNKEKTLNFIQDMARNGVLELSFQPQLNGSPIAVLISVVHKQGVQGIRCIRTPNKAQLRLQLLQYFRAIKAQQVENRAYELLYYGPGP